MRRKVIPWLLATAALGVAFWWLGVAHQGDTVVLLFDEYVAKWIRALRGPAMNSVFFTITLLGSTPFVTATVAAVCAVWLSKGRMLEAAYCAAVAAGGGTLVLVFKELLARERPPILDAVLAAPPSTSFPSGHTMGGLTMAWALCYLTIRHGSPAVRRNGAWVALAGFLLAALVGTSRVYLGVHWPSDVTASWLLGGAWIALLTAYYEVALVRWPVESAA